MAAIQQRYIVRVLSTRNRHKKVKDKNSQEEEEEEEEEEEGEGEIRGGIDYIVKYSPMIIFHIESWCPSDDIGWTYKRE